MKVLHKTKNIPRFLQLSLTYTVRIVLKNQSGMRKEVFLT